MINRGDAVCHPVASPFVVLDLIPIVVFEIELDGKIHTFKKDKVSNVVTNLQPGSVLQVSSGNVTIPSPSDWHSGLKVFSRCHDGEVQPNVTTGRVILLNLSTFRGSVKCEVSILVRSGLCYEVLSMYMSQQRLARVLRSCSA